MNRYSFDYNRLIYICEFLLKTYPWIKVCHPLHKSEDYQVREIILTTTGGTDYYFEVKSVFDSFDSSRLSVSGNTRWDYYGVPSSAITISNIDSVDWNYTTTLPNNARVWMLNAHDSKVADSSKSKWGKISKDTECGLIYLFKDGIEIFTHKDLMAAFRGYAWYPSNSRTELNTPEEAARKKVYGKELKVLIDLSKGKFIPSNPPAELFEKNTERNNKFKLHIEK